MCFTTEMGSFTDFDDRLVNLAVRRHFGFSKPKQYLLDYKFLKWSEEM